MSGSVDVTYEVSVELIKELTAGAEIIKALLQKYGVAETDIIERTEEGHVYISVFFQDKQQADLLKYKFQSLDCKHITSTLIEHHSQEWLNAWKRDWKPFPLTKTIEVIPSWFEGDYQPIKPKVIYLDTISAFGTGLHETTQFMAQFIEECEGSFCSFFDVGTGTGILAIVAKMMGAKHISAIDIDIHSIDVAKQNFYRNRCDIDFIEAYDIEHFPVKHSFDFVAANLVTPDLVKYGKNIVSLVRKGGYLAVSGISVERLQDLKKDFYQLPLEHLKSIEGQKWSAVLYKRR